MKKALLMVLTLLVSAAFVTAVIAQPPAGKPAAVAPQKAHVPAPEKKLVVERKAPEKKAARGRTHQYSGDVTRLDTAAKTIVVKSKKDEMTFDVGMARMKGDVKEGDKVTVKYTKKEDKMMASSVTKETEKKETKKEVKPGAKPVKPVSARK